METRDQLLNLIQEGFFSDPDAMLDSVLALDGPDSDADSFILTYMQFFNFSREESSFKALIRLVSLTDEQIQDQTVTPTSIYQDIAQCATRYISTLFCDPTLFDSSYNLLRLGEEFFEYVTTTTFSINWLQTIIGCLDPDGQRNMVPVVAQIANSVRTLPLNNITIARINLFSNFIDNPDLRLCFVSSPQYFDSSVRSLFTQSVFPLSRNSKFGQFFVSRSDRGERIGITEDSRLCMDAVFKSYHEALAGAIRTLLFKNTASFTLKLISRFVQRLEKSRLVLFGRPSDNDEAFAFNLEAVLVKLALLNRDRFEQIDPTTPYHPAALAPFGESGELALKGGRSTWIDEYNLSRTSSFANAEENDGGPTRAQLDAEWEQILAKRRLENAEPKFVSQFFFVATRASACGTVALLDTFEHLQINAAHLEPNDPKKEILDQLIVSIAELEMMRSRKQELVDYYKMVMNFLIFQTGYEQNDFTLPPYPRQEYARLPEDLLHMLAFGLDFFYRCGLLDDNEILWFMKPFVVLFSNQRYIRNPQIKSEIIRLFSAVASQRGKKHLVISVPHILDLMFPGVIDFFNKVQVTGSHTQFYDKFNFRGSCIILLQFWFVFRDFRDYFVQAVATIPSFQQFVYFLLDDALYFAAEGFDGMLEVFRAEQALPDQNAAEHDQALQSLCGQAGSWFGNLKRSFKLITAIADFCPIAFDGPQQNPSDQTQNDQNANDEILNGQNANGQNGQNANDQGLSTVNVDVNTGHLVLTIFSKTVKEKEQMTAKYPKTAKMAHYDRSDLLLAAVELLIKLYDNVKVPEAIAKNPAYSKELFESIAAEVAGIGKEYKKEGIDEQFAAVMSKLNDVYEVLQQAVVDDSVLDLLPNELMDPFTFQPLTDPLRLPTGHIIQRESLMSAYLHDPVNPFTSTPLKLDECVVDRPTKAAVEWYVEKAKEGQSVDTVFDGNDEKFRDAVTGKLLEEPILLPSGKYVSKKTVFENNMCKDPFNESPINMKSLRVDTKFQLVVEWYLRTSKNQ